MIAKDDPILKCLLKSEKVLRRYDIGPIYNPLIVHINVSSKPNAPHVHTGSHRSRLLSKQLPDSSGPTIVGTILWNASLASHPRSVIIRRIDFAGILFDVAFTNKASPIQTSTSPRND